jgi:endonuclease III
MQERTRGDPWRVLLVSVLLNRTRGSQAEPVLWEVLRRWPRAASVSAAGDDLEALLRPLGIWRRRASGLRALASAYVRLLSARRTALAVSRRAGEPSRTLTREDVLRLPGVGPYAADGWELFVLRRLPADDPADKELVRYVRWLRASGRSP